MSKLSDNLQTIKDATDIIRGKLNMPTDVIGDVANAVKVPTGNIEITQNGTDIDVADYATASVEVEPDPSEYFNNVIYNGSPSYSGITYLIKKVPDNIPVYNNNLSHAFSYCRNLLNAPLIDTSNVTNMSNMFYYCEKLVYVPLYNTSSVTNMKEAFSYCRQLEEIPLFDTTNVTNMAAMLNQCNKLKNVPLFNTSNVTDMSGMLQYCSGLTSLPLFDTSKVQTMSGMLMGVSKLQEGSLNNLLQMCINATNYTGAKTLYSIFNTNYSSVYPASTIQSLSNYQDFINAGWTIGWE